MRLLGALCEAWVLSSSCVLWGLSCTLRILRNGCAPQAQDNRPRYTPLVSLINT